jgi:hypothetical protein
MEGSAQLLVAANAKMEALLPEQWERDEDTDNWVRRAEIILRKGKNNGIRLFARQYRADGEAEPFRSVVELRLKNGYRATVEDGRGGIAGWNPQGLGDPFNLDIGDRFLNDALKESLDDAAGAADGRSGK